jgi:hypothetical protein
VAVDPESLRFALFATRFLVDAARREPLLLVLEDLHAADAASLLLLRFLGEGIAGSPILVLGSYREGERRVREPADSFAGLVRIARRIPLRGLSAAEVEAYLASVVSEGGTRAATARLHASTGGNPFFLGDVVGLVAAGGALEEDGTGRGSLLRVPEEVRALVRRRVSPLSRAAVETLRSAAVIGREVDLRVLERTSRLPVGRLMDLLGEGVDAGALVEDPARTGRFAFTHELVRETLYEDIPRARRLEIHLAIGRALEELHRGEPDLRLEEIAHHLALAAPLGDVIEAVDYLTHAGDRASGLVAYEEAATHYERALQLMAGMAEAPGDRRCELLLRLGESQWRAGDIRLARATFEDALGLARLLKAPEMFADAEGAGDVRRSGPRLRRRAERLPSRRAVDMARRLGDAEALVTALHCSHWALGTPDMVQERLANTREMLEIAAKTRNQEIAFLAHNARFHCFMELGEAQPIAAEIEAMSQLAERMRQPVYRWHTECVRVIRATLDGRFDDTGEGADACERRGPRDRDRCRAGPISARCSGGVAGTARRGRCRRSAGRSGSRCAVRRSHVR